MADITTPQERPCRLPTNELSPSLVQDLTGGRICLHLAVYAYMADITTPQERTRRLAILESFMPLGFLFSIPGGTYLKGTKA
jgi:hypothetical protein